MDWNGLFNPISAKLRDPDPMVQGDVGVDLFQLWFQYAASYAKGELSGGKAVMLVGTEVFMEHLVAVQYPHLLKNPNTDDYVTRALMESFRKVCTILISKPKFHALIEGQDGPGFAAFVSERILPLLSEAAFSPGSPQTNRTEVLKTMTSLVELGVNMMETMPSTFPAMPFKFRVEAIMTTALTTSLDMMHRQAALDCLRAMGKSNLRATVARGLAHSANEMMALELMWSMGALEEVNSVAVLIARVKKAATTKNNRFPLELVSSLQSLLSHGARADDTGGVDVVTHLDRILDVVEACDKIRSEYKDDEDERSQEVIDIISLIISLCPDSPRALALALNPYTLESVAMLASHTDELSAETWLSFLLPLLYQKVAEMQLQGVSGDMLEQETINLLRDCPRVFYINQDKMPSVELGRYVFHTVVQAMRHGYIETERFPYVAAIVCEHHLLEGGDQWLSEVFADTVADTHKTFRALEECVQLMLGIHTSSIRDQPVSLEKQQAVLKAVAGVDSAPAFAMIASLCNTYNGFVVEQEAVVRSALMSVQRAVRTMVKERSVKKRYLDAIVSLCTSLALRITPYNAPLLFDVTLQAYALSPPNTPTGFTDDVTLECIVNKVPLSTPLPLNAVEEALATAGPNTRYALAEFVPERCIHDPVGAVRAQALRVLQRRPEVLYKHAADVFACVQSPSDFQALYPEAHLRMSELEFATAAAPLMAMLALNDTLSCLGPALVYLSHAAKVTQQNEAMNRVMPAVLIPLDRICNEGSYDAIRQGIVASPLCAKVFTRLEKVSVPWARLIARLVREGTLAHSTVNGYSVTKTAIRADAPPAYTEQNPLASEPAGPQSSAVKAYEAGDLIGAVRLSNQLKRRNPRQFKETGHGFLTATLLPGVAATILPAPVFVDGKSKFEERALNDYTMYARIFNELQSLFPEECESVLQLSSRRQELNLAMVHRYLDAGDPTGARQWMSSMGIHSPGLQTVVDKWELQHDRSRANASTEMKHIQALAPPPAADRSRPRAAVDRSDSLLLELDSISPPQAPPSNDDVWSGIGAIRPAPPPPSGKPGKRAVLA